MSATPSSAFPTPDPKVDALRGVSIFHNTPGAPPLTGPLIELAPKDVLFTTSKLYPPGTMLHLHLYAARHDLEIATLGMVHWSAEVLGVIQCGVFLRSVLPQEWLDHYWDDHRKELRFNGQWLLRAWADETEERLDVVVGNYSRNGAQFLTRHHMTTGEAICIGTPDNYVRAVVRWCREADHECFRVGCELERDAGVRLASILRFSSLDL